MASPSDRFRRPTPQVTRGGGLSGAGLLIAALLTAAFGVGVVGGGYLLFARPSVSPDVSEAIASATGRTDPSELQPIVDDGAWTDADLASCKAEATAAADIAAKRRLAAVSADRVGLGGPDAEMVERATYLLCGATRKPKHLCDPYWKGWLIEGIRAYAIEFRQVSFSAYWTKVEVADQARRDDQGKWQAISEGLDQTTLEVAAMHGEIVAAFRERIADGIVAPDDFGKFLGLGIPPEIVEMIGDARPVRALCG
jgi:hypothetical protein